MEKRGRELDVKEAQTILETTATRSRLISWFDPFWDQMRTAVERKKDTVILGGRDFNVRHYKDRSGREFHVFMVRDDFVPMISILDHELKNRMSADAVSAS